MPRYTIQQHGEWSGRDDVLDLDFEADTLAEAHKIIREEIPAGVIYILIDEETGEQTESVR